MAYTLRIKSNAFEADSAITKMLGALESLKRGARGLLRMKNETFGGNRLQDLYGINTRTFERAMDWADQDFDQQIMLDQWRWKGSEGETRRKNGQVVTEPRDIVDTGELLRSKKRTQVSRNVVDFEWTAEHAEGVHDGYTSKKGTVNPARPWTEPTLADIDVMIENMLRNGGRG